MDEDSITTEPWRRARLGEEPIYCAAPPPSNPDDIICLGSDGELDETERVAKRLRYEAQAIRYLQGKPLRIISASLHGPFDGDSGWRNPWLPRQPAIKKSALKPRYPIKLIPPFKKHPRKVSEQSRQQSDTTSDTDNSTRCHLPSPESNRGLQLPSNTSESEKHSQIQAWAKDVYASKDAILERDPFWAPKEVHHGENNEPGRKRSAGKERFKKISKRKRLSTSRDMDTGSAPTPLIPTQAPVRSVSVPLNTPRSEKSVFPKLEVNQSFEYTTLSSTIIERYPGGETMPLGEIPISGIQLNARDTIVQPTNIRPDSVHGRPLQEDKCELLEDPIKQDAQMGREVEEDPEFESHIAQVTHHRAQLMKREALPTHPNVSGENIHSKLTQTRTPESPGDKDTAATTVPENQYPPLQTVMSERCDEMESIAIARASMNLIESMRGCQGECDGIQGYECQLASSTLKEEMSRDQRVDCNSERLYGYSENPDFIAETNSRLSNNQKTPSENLDPVQVDTTSTSIKTKTANNLHTEDTISDVMIDNSHIPPTVLNVETTNNNEAIDSPPETEVRPTEFGLLVDEGSTLVGDPMGFNRVTPIEASGLLTLNHVSISANTKTEAHDPTRTSTGTTRETGSDTIPDPVIVPLSRLERAVGEGKTKPLITNVEESPKKGTPTVVTLMDPPDPFTRQVQWISAPPSSTDLVIENIKLEPFQDRSRPSQPLLLGFQASGHPTPDIKGSQQSPWVKEILGPTITNGLPYDSPTIGETTPIDALHTAAMYNDCQGPRHTTDISVMPRSGFSPNSPIPAMYNNRSLFPLSGSSTRPCELDDQSLKHRADVPTTPPQMPTVHSRTPDLERSIKPFSLFNTPSPKRQRRSSYQHSSTSRAGGILSNTTHSESRTSQRPKRVSFALQQNGDDADIPSLNATRAASPPPETLVNAGDEDVDNQFQGHFDAIKQRANKSSIHSQPQQRLLPRFSQQRLTSPHISAMAQAFREADAYAVCASGNPAEDNEENDTDDVSRDIANVKQSPWRKESQDIDHVADVMENLDDFINAWDVNVELQKARQESSIESFDRETPW
ncbi:hypothetical protein F5Y11DRAFT_336224 [Daldinia sp. FL1419]|nr:hypothetical protein F5Y11DRAFT_336224 [Daldinia sp. FL1419]